MTGMKLIILLDVVEQYKNYLRKMEEAFTINELSNIYFGTFKKNVTGDIF